MMCAQAAECPSITPSTPLDPDIVEGDSASMSHMMWAMFEEDAAGEDAHIGFWATSDGQLVIQSFQANQDVRGRAMLLWLRRYNLPIHVVEVIPAAIGFWDKMVREGLVAAWEIADGFPSHLEQLSVPLPNPVDRNSGSPMQTRPG